MKYSKGMKPDMKGMKPDMKGMKPYMKGMKPDMKGMKKKMCPKKNKDSSSSDDNEPVAEPEATVEDVAPYLHLIRALPNLKVLNGQTITPELRSRLATL